VHKGVDFARELVLRCEAIDQAPIEIREARSSA
jgi:hypothetical protein